MIWLLRAALREDGALTLSKTGGTRSHTGARMSKAARTVLATKAGSLSLGVGVTINNINARFVPGSVGFVVRARVNGDPTFADFQAAVRELADDALLSNVKGSVTLEEPGSGEPWFVSQISPGRFTWSRHPKPERGTVTIEARGG